MKRIVFILYLGLFFVACSNYEESESELEAGSRFVSVYQGIASEQDSSSLKSTYPIYNFYGELTGEIGELTFGVMKNSGYPMVVLYKGTWSGPCKVIHPQFEQSCNQNDDTGYPVMKYVIIDVDKHPELATREDVRVIPTLKVYCDGRCVGTEVGVKYADQIDLFIKTSMELYRIK